MKKYKKVVEISIEIFILIKDINLMTVRFYAVTFFFVIVTYDIYKCHNKS
jgi:hypothetical protein